ncbi:MAG: PEP/pyruvate-binding domain-containing protein, partial [Actinomycetota bacterium]
MSTKPKKDQLPLSPTLSGFWLDLRETGSLAKVNVARAGGKAANLARLAELGMPTPRAVVLTTDAWRFFLDSSGLGPRLAEALAGLDSDPDDVDLPARKIAELISAAVMPAVLEEQIRGVYDDLSGCGSSLIAIRSSGSYEDSPEASFSGMLSTVLGVSHPE